MNQLLYVVGVLSILTLVLIAIIKMLEAFDAVRERVDFHRTKWDPPSEERAHVRIHPRHYRHDGGNVSRIYDWAEEEEAS